MLVPRFLASLSLALAYFEWVWIGGGPGGTTASAVMGAVDGIPDSLALFLGF